jgi:hypothetical protein
MGGAWENATTVRAEKSRPSDSLAADNIATTTGDKELPCTDDDFTKGACVLGIVLQQSMP